MYVRNTFPSEHSTLMAVQLLNLISIVYWVLISVIKTQLVLMHDWFGEKEYTL